MADARHRRELERTVAVGALDHVQDHAGVEHVLGKSAEQAVGRLPAQRVGAGDEDVELVGAHLVAFHLAVARGRMAA